MGLRMTLIGASLAALLLAGCGDSDGSAAGKPDHSSPEQVAEAYAKSFYSCGKKGAGARVDLVYPPDQAAFARDAIAEEEAPDSTCQPEQAKPFTTAVVPSQWPDVAMAVQVSNADCDQEDIPLIQVDGRWLVIEGDNKADPNYFCSHA